jgi:hypothetical protein
VEALEIFERRPPACGPIGPRGVVQKPGALGPGKAGVIFAVVRDDLQFHPRHAQNPEALHRGIGLGIGEIINEDHRGLFKHPPNGCVVHS